MPKISSPIALSAFPSTTDGVWSFPCALVFDKAVHDVTTLRLEYLIDTFPTFTSPNAKDLFSDGAGIVAFNNGPLGKSIDVKLPNRSMNGDQTWYWKVRVNGYGYAGSYISDWTNVNSFVVPVNPTRDIATSLWNDVADNFAYSKEANSSNFYKILNMIARELDAALLENKYTQRDLSLEMSRDTGLQNNFGTMTALQTVSTEPSVSYRWKVRELFKAFIQFPGTITGIKRVVKAFVGEDPLVLDETNVQGWILPINMIFDPNHPTVLNPPPIILYSTLDKGFFWKLYIWNSWNLTFDTSVLENYVNLIKPAHTKTTFIYQTQRHAQIRFNTAADWNSCVLTNLVPNASGGLTLVDPQLTGTAVTPIIHIKNMSSWDTLDVLKDQVGQSIVFQLRTSPDGVGSFTPYETLTVGQAPINTIIQDYIQLQVTITTTNSAIKPVVNYMALNTLHT